MRKSNPVMPMMAGALAGCVLITALALAGEQKDGGDGWIDLTSKQHWQQTDGWQFKGNKIHLPKKGAGYLWTKRKYEDFVLELEVNTTGNSGIFFRANPSNPVHGGFEMQVLRPKDGTPGSHNMGALYDIRAPREKVAKDGWNHVRITCKGPHITACMNGTRIWKVDISRWTEPKRNPDGSKNKFKNALADLPRNNHIGFQDHGHEVTYRNVRIRPLPAK